MTVRAGEFWIADVLFTGGGVSKKRPVLVLWLDGLDAVVAAVTTAGPRSHSDVALGDWSSSGLRRPSTVRLSRLDCFERKLLVARIGTISSNDAQAIKETWANQIKLQF